MLEYSRRLRFVAYSPMELQACFQLQYFSWWTIVKSHTVSLPALPVHTNTVFKLRDIVELSSIVCRANTEVSSWCLPPFLVEHGKHAQVHHTLDFFPPIPFYLSTTKPHFTFSVVESIPPTHQSSSSDSPFHSVPSSPPVVIKFNRIQLTRSKFTFTFRHWKTRRRRRWVCCLVEGAVACDTALPSFCYYLLVCARLRLWRVASIRPRICVYPPTHL